jgi:hypothetical protein
VATLDKVQVSLTRDSVCAGDDADAPHQQSMLLYPHPDPIAFLEQFSSGYLASVNGVGHWWRAILNGKPVAIVRVNGIEPLVAELDLGGQNSLYFEYHSATY